MKKLLAAAAATVIAFGGLGVLPSAADRAELNITASAEGETSNLRKIFEDYVAEKRAQEDIPGPLKPEISNYVEDGDVAYGTYGNERSEFCDIICVITADGVNEFNYADVGDEFFNGLFKTKSIMPFSIGEDKFLAALGDQLSYNVQYAVSVFRVVDSKLELTRVDTKLIDTNVSYRTNEISGDEGYYYEGSPDDRSTDVRDFITVNEDSITFDGAKYTWDSERKEFGGNALCYEELIPNFLEDKYGDLVENEYGFGAYVSVTYAVYDMNNDGTPELLIHSGTCEADSIITIFTFDGSEVKKIGEGNGFHRGYFSKNDKGQFVVYGGKEGIGFLDTYIYDGKDMICSEGTFEFLSNDEFDAELSKLGNFTPIENRYACDKVDYIPYHSIPIDCSFIRHAVAEIENAKASDNSEPQDSNEQNTDNEQNNDNNQNNDNKQNTGNANNAPTENNSANNGTNNPKTGSAAAVSLGAAALSAAAAVVFRRRKK